MTIFGIGGGFAIMIETMVEKKSRGFGSSKLAEILRSLLLLSYSILSVWFWYHGRGILVSNSGLFSAILKGVSPSKDDLTADANQKLLASCNWRVFFFSSTSIQGWFHKFSQGLSIIVLVANTVRIWYMSLEAWVNRRDIRSWLLLASTLPKIRVQRRRDMWALLATQTISFGMFAAVIELFLAWNLVRDVNSVTSAGQLIPLVTALSGLGTVCLSRTDRN